MIPHAAEEADQVPSLLHSTLTGPLSEVPVVQLNAAVVDVPFVENCKVPEDGDDSDWHRAKNSSI